MFNNSNSSQNDENLNKAYSIQDNEGYEQDVLGVSERDYSDHSHITVYDDDDGRCSFDVDDDGNITNIHETSNDNQDDHDDYSDCHINDFYQ